jgi:hypothetical protein
MYSVPSGPSNTKSEEPPRFMDSDSLALEFLHEHRYDMVRAKFALLSMAGVGADELYTVQASKPSEQEGELSVNMPPLMVLGGGESTSSGSQTGATSQAGKKSKNKSNSAQDRNTKWRDWISAARAAMFGTTQTRATLDDLVELKKRSEGMCTCIYVECISCFMFMFCCLRMNLRFYF